MNKAKSYQKIRKNILKMLEARCIQIPEELTDTSFEYISNLIKKNELDIIINNDYYIKFLINEKVRPSMIKSNIEKIKENNITNFIIVIENKPNKSILKLVNNTDIQIFWFNELLIDKTSHVLVPKHILLEEQFHQEVLDMYGLNSKSKLPLILINDPMVKYLNAKKGDILKIIRNSSTAGKYVSYRYVV